MDCFFIGHSWTPLLLLLVIVQSTVLPPPWADPKINPCAAKPRGWQLLYWPEDGKCYKIFQVGYPCPETMELVPSKNNISECRCPPSYAQYVKDGKCYKLFEGEPCQAGEYFSLIDKSSRNKNRRGTCKKIERCLEENELFWPKDQTCYKRLTRGPCAKGQLLIEGPGKRALCHCSSIGETEKFYSEMSNTCHEHYTKGPCIEKGHLFLPGRKCGCHELIPHFNKNTEQCFELDTIGPCNQGQIFKITNGMFHAQCVCKDNHIYWPETGLCYRLYTQGPCNNRQIISNTGCVAIPCPNNHLYFPDQNKCYHIGSQGPCPEGQLVTFDFQARPSVDGISYNGLCGCPTLDCANKTICDIRGTVKINNTCYKFYTQGPCQKGQWLVPQRQPKMLWQDGMEKIHHRCECRPGYSQTFSVTEKNETVIQCAPPFVTLARYLNNFTKD